MTGVIWFVQIIHYPLFERVGETEFANYHHQHTEATGWVVGPPMLVELISSLVLLYFQPTGMIGILNWAGMILVTIIWLSTAFLQIPLHDQLASGFQELSHRRLVLTNIVRTVAWSVHSLILLFQVGPG